MATNLGCLHPKFAYNHCGEMDCRNYVNKCPAHSLTSTAGAVCNLTRASVLSGLSDEARETIDRAISLCPALEETILLIVELVFRDGEEGCEYGCMPMDHRPEPIEWGEPGKLGDPHMPIKDPNRLNP